MFRRAFPLLLLILLCLKQVYFVQAQNAFDTTLYPIDTSQFPILSAYLDVRDEQGHFVPGLNAADLRVLENNHSQPIDNLIQLSPGTQFVTAIAPGDSMSIRDGLGNTRYDYLSQALSHWARQLPSPPQDDLSLVVDSGPQVIHTTDVNEWITSLENYTPTTQSDANLLVLSAALDTVNDPTEQEGTSRVVLLITSPLVEGSEIGLNNLLRRANQEGIRIFVWFVAAPEYFDSPSAILLQELAAQTGGEFFAFSHDEIIPDLETYLSPLRSVYSLTYTSQLSTSGTHEVSIEVNTLELQTISSPRRFELQVEPPNPIFVSPPSEIMRAKAELTGPEGKEITPAPDQDLLMPSNQTIEILIEFPDGHSRQIITSTLYVDNIIADQNTSAPFEKFTWDLSEYTSNSSHSLRVEATDSLGLTGKTVDFPVQVTVTANAATNMLQVISQQGALSVGIVVAATGGILILVLIIGGKIRPRVYGQPQTTRKNTRRQTTTRKRDDPLTQPIQSQTEAKSNWSKWLKRSQRKKAPTALAFLTPLSDETNGKNISPISITTGELMLGSSPAHATVILDDPSIENLHACLRHEENTFRLLDQGSAAGTWVNYLPVSQSGVLLTHGDIVHIGRMKFRFTLRKPVQVRKPLVLYEEVST